ncbi:acyl-CoA thioesterase [Limnohabitans sp.]|uniref:acyl-CoA thioesterase n=1 Tax=Limnohabitans sp. TaxID=1907725 RepID=UPI0039BCD306|nr:thioesterase family protein [Comamonadaceae bacterium]
MHPLDQAIALRASERQDLSQEFTGATHPAYANMVGPFGGTAAAQLLQCAMLHPERIGEPVALTVNFAAPVADGEIRFVARPVRTNRSTQHWIIEAHQAPGVVATATAVFAVRRETWSDVEAVMPANVPVPDAVARMPVKGMPAWPQRYDMRFVEGAFPSAFDEQEQTHSRSTLWVRDEPERALDFASLAALSDSFFPRIYIRRRRRAMIGTVSLTTYFHADSALLAQVGTRHVLGVAKALNYQNGYFDQTGELWSPEGQLLASTHQLVYFKD